MDSFLKSSYKDYDKFIANRKKQRKTFKAKLKNLIEELTEPCLFCGTEDDIIFHHINANEKVEAVARCTSIKSVLRETKKCWCLCSDCHSKLHQRLVDPLPECYV